MKAKNEDRSPARMEKADELKDRKPGKSAHGKRGGDDDSSGGSRQGNAGLESDRYGSFGNR
jgi:hypothetical protein